MFSYLLGGAKKRWMGILLISVLTILLGSATVGLAEQKAWELIKWNKPKPWPERLLADKYILPEGWKKATEGVKEIAFHNSGGLAYDIATAMNIARFEQLTGIKVNAIPVAADIAYAKGLSTLVAKDKSVDAVLSNDPAWDLSVYASGNWLTPVDHMYPPEVLKLYSRAIKDYFMWGGHWWALPVTCIGHIEFYRPGWLAQAGVTVPRTWEEYYVAAKKCDTWGKQNLGADYYGTVFVGGTIDFFNSIRAMCYSQDKKLFENGKYQFSSPEFKNAFGLVTKLIREGIAPRDVLAYAWGDAATFFGMGKAAFLSAIQPSYITVFASQFPEVADDFATFAPPKWSAEEPEAYRGRGVIGSNSMLINKYINDNQKAAVMLWADFVRSKEAQRHELIVEGNESYMLSLWENIDTEIRKVDWDFADRIADELKIPHVKHITSLSAKEARELNVTNTIFTIYPPGFQEIIRKGLEEFGKAALGEISIDKACEEIQKFAEELGP